MQTHRIEIPERFNLGPGAHVVIREKRSWSAQQRVDQAGLRVKPSAEDARKVESFIADVLERGLAVLETAIVSWEGVRDARGVALPASRAGYLHEDFDPDLGDWLVDGIEAWYAAQRRTEEAGKAAATPSSAP